MSYLHFLAMGSDPMDDTKVDIKNQKVDIESPEADIKQRIIQYIRENARSYQHFFAMGSDPMDQWFKHPTHIRAYSCKSVVKRLHPNFPIATAAGVWYNIGR